MLLTINGNGQTWERSRTKAGAYEWKTEDRKLQAVYSESKFLVITTAGYLKRLDEAAKKKKKSKEENKQRASSGGQKSGGRPEKKETQSTPPEKALKLTRARPTPRPVLFQNQAEGQ